MIFKKPSYPINRPLAAYLERYKRTTAVPVRYEDLLRFAGSVAVYNHQDDDTLWVRVFYLEEERKEIDIALKKIYSILHSDGSDSIFEDLSVDAIDYCTFGNSKPFRIKIRNIINDNYTYFYVKKSDASRIYGLELEHLLSPYNLNFLVSEDTLIEEHIAGIPGDVFISHYLPSCTERQRAQLAKEFVKFNERCMIRLLGDMRAYNYVVIPVHDFDSVIHKIRAIDFDQQNYEGDLKVYRPQFFPENEAMMRLIKTHLKRESVFQYKREERSSLAKRALGAESQLRRLVESAKLDELSSKEHIDQLGNQISQFTGDQRFARANSMGVILELALLYVIRNYKDLSVI
ncbi:MAG: hypothetical protein RLZZ242_657 [Bacteroidota bacterium]